MGLSVPESNRLREGTSSVPKRELREASRCIRRRLARVAHEEDCTTRRCRKAAKTRSADFQRADASRSDRDPESGGDERRDRVPLLRLVHHARRETRFATRRDDLVEECRRCTAREQNERIVRALP